MHVDHIRVTIITYWLLLILNILLFSLISMVAIFLFLLILFNIEYDPILIIVPIELKAG
jgi:hypothetical protein